MSELVDPTQVATIFGIERHETDHYGHAITDTEEVFILHSAECRATTPDLRDCPYSVALDRGIEHPLPWTGWRRVLDTPIRLEIAHGYLMPDFTQWKAALAAGRERKPT